MATDETILNIQDVAAFLKVRASWVYDRLRDNAPDRLPGYKLGKYWRFRRLEILAWLDARKV
jgi:predicted DNA-binding transcriptional regulator AlpA